MSNSISLDSPSMPSTRARTQTDLAILETLLSPIFRELYPIAKDSICGLNIACGSAEETGVLISTLAPLCQHLHLTGVDIRERQLDEARQRWPSLPRATLHFIKHDASRLREIRTLPREVDFVLMRHQNFWNGAETWIRIYDSALQQLAPEGRLIITSYFDREHAQAIRAITALGAQLLHTFQNPNSRVLLREPLKSVDRHIAIFSKPSQKDTQQQQII